LKLSILGCESLGVRGLSSFIEHRGFSVLIDPGVALGYTRMGFHPHPIQAVAGDEARSRIITLWGRADYIILTHLHGDHVPLFNANPFQLNLYSLGRTNAEIIVPNMTLLTGRMRVRLEKIIEAYNGRITMIEGNTLEKGPITVYGPYRHGLSKTGVYIVKVDLGERIVHLSDTELLNSEVVELVVKLRPDIIITDGPPIYKYLYDKTLTDTMLRKASINLERLSHVAETIIVDHHILRCDQGYKWLTEKAKKYGDTRILSAANYMHETPLLLEAWRSILYKYYPVPNNWFKQYYTSLIEKYRPIYHEIKKKMGHGKGNRVIFEKMIRELSGISNRF
jgi:predicted metallo-beta-lactamase superfamily hydrolase